MKNLRQKYERAIDTASNVGWSGFVAERDGRLFFKGSVGTQEYASRIWTAIKAVPTWRYEVVADILIERRLTQPEKSGSGFTGDESA